MEQNRYINFFIASFFLLIFFFLYASAIDFSAPGILNHNVIFDIDPERVINDMAGSEKIVEVHKHPLYGLFFRAIIPPIIQLCETLRTGLNHHESYSFEIIEKIAQQPLDTTAVTFLICFAGACSVAISFLIFTRFLNNRSDAIFFTLLFGLSPPVWVLSSVPETFSLNLLCIVCAFYLQAALPYKTFSQRSMGHGVFFLLGFVAIGITLPNIIYVAVCYLLYLKRQQLQIWQFAGTMFIYSFALYGAIALGSFIQSNMYAVTFTHISPMDYGSVFIRENTWNHNIHLGRDVLLGCVQLGRSFFLETLIAPKVILHVYHYVDSWRILAFSYEVSWVFVLGVLGYCVALISCVRVLFNTPVLSGEVIIAIFIIGFNCLFHTFVHGLGIPFIYSIHVVFPLLFLLAVAYKANAFHFKKVFLVVFVCTVILNNSLFISRLNNIIKNDDLNSSY